MSDSLILRGESPEEVAEALARAQSDGSIAAVAETVLATAAASAWDQRLLADRLARIDCAVLLPHLLDGLRDDDDAGRRSAARSLLAAIASPDAISADAALRRLAALLAEGGSDDRVLAATTLGESGNPEAVEPLVAALDDEANVAAAAADALGTLGDARAVDPLVRVLSGEDAWTRCAAAVALGRLRDRRAVPALLGALEDGPVVEVAVRALREIGDPAALGPLRRVAAGGGGTARAAIRAAAAILAARGDDRVPGWLRDRLAGRESALYRELLDEADPLCARLLGAAGTAEAAERLLVALDRPELRDAAAAGLSMLPDRVLCSAVLPRLAAVSPERRALLLSALPPLQPDEVETVARHLADDYEGSRRAAADAIARSDRASALDALRSALQDPDRRLGAIHGLGSLATEGCAELSPLLDGPDPSVRDAVAHALARCAQPGTGSAIAAALETESDPEVRESLVHALGEAGGADAVATLAPLAEGEDMALRFAALAALGRTGSELALTHLLNALESEDRDLRCAAAHSLGNLGSAGAGGAVSRLLADHDRDTRRVATMALGEIATTEVIDHLIAATGDPDWGVRLAAVEALARIDDPRALPPLRAAAARDADATVRRAAQDALAPAEARGGA